MDILTHTLSGLAVGTVIASFSERGNKEKLLILGTSGLAGAFPDIDAISLWSQFDSIIGRLLNLPHSGNSIYFAKFWYSHHGFFHSLLAGILFSIILISAYCLQKNGFRNFRSSNLIDTFKKYRLVLIGFIGAYFIHLLGDMPTPSSVWGGVNLLWPSAKYMGGSGDIWWWNNYDIFLIALLVIVINLLLHLSRKLIVFKLKMITLGVCIMGFSLAFFQIKTRNYDFAYSGHTSRYNDYELKSKDLQRQILGERVYNKMEQFDNKLKIHF